MHTMNTAVLLATILALSLGGPSINGPQNVSTPHRAIAGADALVLAARDNDTGRIATLIGQGIDVNAQGTRGTTPLMSAAASASIDALRFLIRAGADPNRKAPRSKTALSMAIEYFTPNHSEGNKNDFVTVVRELIAAGAEINVHDDNGLTPLLWASAAGNEHIASVLLDAGANVNARSRVRISRRLYLTVTPLIYSVINSTNDRTGAIRLIRLLIDRGADVEARDSQGRTALKWAEQITKQDQEQSSESEILSILRKSVAARRWVCGVSWTQRGLLSISRRQRRTAPDSSAVTCRSH